MTTARCDVCCLFIKEEDIERIEENTDMDIGGHLTQTWTMWCVRCWAKFHTTPTKETT